MAERDPKSSAPTGNGPPPPTDTPAGRRKAYAYVQRRLADGRTPEAVRQRLLAAGYSREETEALIERANKAAMLQDVVGTSRGGAGRDPAERAAQRAMLDGQLADRRRRNETSYLVPILTLLIGLGLCAIGIGITALSFWSVSGGGPGLFTFGFIISGGAMVLRGGYQLGQNFFSE